MSAPSVSSSPPREKSFSSPDKDSPESKPVSNSSTSSAWTRIRDLGYGPIQERATMAGRKSILIINEINEGRLIVAEKVAKAWCCGHGGFVPVEIMEADHMEPASHKNTANRVANQSINVEEDGLNDIANLWLLCRDCNASKGTSDPIEYLKPHSDFGMQFLKEIAPPRREGFLEWAQDETNNSLDCEIIYRKKAWKLCSVNRPEEYVSVIVERDMEMPLEIGFWKNESDVFVAPAIEWDKICVIYEIKLPLSEALKEKWNNKIVYKEQEWTVVDLEDQEDKTEFTIQRDAESHAVFFDKRSCAIQIDKQLVNNEAIQVPSLASKLLQNYLSDGLALPITLRLSYPHASNPEWKAKISQDSAADEVVIDIEVPEGTPLTVNFNKFSRQWTKYSTCEDLATQILVRHSEMDSQFCCRNNEGVVCAYGGEKLGTVAVEFYHRSHQDKVRQKKQAEAGIFIPLEKRIDAINLSKYQGNTVGRELHVMDKRLHLLVEAVKLDDPFESDSDNDLQPSEKRAAFQEAVNTVLKNTLRQTYREVKKRIKNLDIMSQEGVVHQEVAKNSTKSCSDGSQ